MSLNFCLNCDVYGVTQSIHVVEITVVNRHIDFFSCLSSSFICPLRTIRSTAAKLKYISISEVFCITADDDYGVRTSNRSEICSKKPSTKNNAKICNTETARYHRHVTHNNHTYKQNHQQQLPINTKITDYGALSQNEWLLALFKEQSMKR